MKKSKFYDCCIFIALFIVGISLFVTLKLQLEMKSRIAIASASQTPTTEVFTARNNVTLSTHETKSITEPDGNTTLSEAQTDKPVSEKPSAKTTAKAKPETTAESTELDSVLIINTNSKKIHSSTCSYARNIKEENKIAVSSDELQSYLNDGYTVCSRCKGYRE